ncbi:MAG: 23S rRNA (uracil(1939)-C(5))-methyltransferase RlmD [bacterium]|nr:23S rRNA (uracil(1939)-C(5))-methyltransferase RlmD [bacterium]
MNIPLKLDRMVYGGEAIGRYDGKVVFVNGGIEGELVDAQIIRQKKDYLRGNIVRIIQASEQRAAPLCKYFDICGGCQWQYIDYPQQLRFKEKIVHDQLVRIGGFDNLKILPIIGMEFPWQYRNKARFVVKAANHGFAIGFYRIGTRVVVDIDYCHLISEQMNQGYAALRKIIKERLKPFHAYCAIEIRALDEGIMVFFITSPNFHLDLTKIMDEIQDIPVIKGLHYLVVDNDESSVRTVYSSGTAAFTYSFEDITVQAQAVSFFQINLIQSQKLFYEAIQLLNPQEADYVLDGHCGVGALTLLVAQKAREIVGVDISTSSINDARTNALFNQIKNVHFLQDSLKQAITRLDDLSNGSRFDAVILNPPRDGIVEKQVIQWLLQTKPAKIIYISCNPATLARDLKLLCQGGYSLNMVQPVDMFPQTYHVESIASLQIAG